MNPILNDDVLSCILDELHAEYAALRNCSLVCRSLNQLATKILYSKVIWSPTFRPTLNLKDKGLPPPSSMFSSACLPHHAPKVMSLEISGYLSPRPPPLNQFPMVLLNAIQSFVNMRSCRLTPTMYHEDLFTDILGALKSLPYLSHLAVNSSCMDAPRTPMLVQITGINVLVLQDPTRAILDALPSWLADLTLTELHLKGNCGSITPGVLKSLVSQLANITAFSLGLSYSLTDEDVFSFLSQLLQLRSVALQYYLQLRRSPVTPFLPNLRSFTVYYSPAWSRDEADRLGKWIRTVITSSPIEHLALLSDNNFVASNVRFDGIVHHLASKHAGRLRHLEMPHAFISVDALRLLCKECSVLEELSVAGGKNVLAVLDQCIPQMKCLHTAQINVRNIKQSLSSGFPSAGKDIMFKSARLRRLNVNGYHLEAHWTASTEGNVELAVEQVSPQFPPWEVWELKWLLHRE
ncbi:uncharacterized protein EV420DRAFT_1761372 [Desarmillaria tabescens]|uniref:F-box domain-containing protein n=1 Tax=Armillaria tabescens TaxID=1929756 RepID=A0AA39NCD3_ARMTA|nr:uncharacterized protein EV420DRAFT_1761372 [Desarmillaria tabescens]KAK0463037.1 hypothetical protein EV420DRAFT_1761372 [Desarmillaria tabescens]